MSRHLPPHPNLDHLKKQAKELLHESQLRNPGLRLADAQHAIAREYGFASWPKLKVYVESLPGSLSQRVPEQASPFAGAWTANPTRSRPHPANPFQRATLQVGVVGDVVTIDDMVVNGSGREERGRNTIRADGNEHPSERGNGYVLMARWRGSHVLETVATKNGEVVGWGTYEVSADGTTLTVSGDQQTIVLDRM